MKAVWNDIVILIDQELATRRNRCGGGQAISRAQRTEELVWFGRSASGRKQPVAVIIYMMNNEQS